MRKLYRLQYALIVLALLINQNHTHAQSRAITRIASRSDAQRLRRLESQFEQMRQELKIPGMSAAVVKDGWILWAKGFGYADIQRRIK